MTRTPRSVRFALLLMGGLILSQVVGVRRVGHDAGAAGLRAAPVIAPAWAATESLPVASARPAAVPAPSAPQAAPARVVASSLKFCRSTARAQRIAPAAPAGAASVPPERRAT